MPAKTPILYSNPFDNAEIAGREISDKQTTSSSERRGAAFLVTFPF